MFGICHVAYVPAITFLHPLVAIKFYNLNIGYLGRPTYLDLAFWPGGHL